MEVGTGHFLEGLGVGENAEALGQELVELCDWIIYLSADTKGEGKKNVG
jgi:hypothetical protein